MNYRSSSYSGFGSPITKAVKTLIIINVGIFLLRYILPHFPWGILVMTPRLVFSNFMLWQLVTYMFLHADLLHLFFNMMVLWFFGPALESVWGRKQFLFFYFFTGIGAALSSFIFSFNSSIIGASGAIFGILVAYAVMHPEEIVILFIFPMRARYAVLVLGVFNLLGAISSSGEGIAYVAHLGGALFGYLYLKSEWLKFQAAHFNLNQIKNLYQSKRPKRKSHPQQKNSSRTVDEILDKISKQGIGNLTAEERRILEEKSREK